MPEPLDHLYVAGFSEARPFKSTLSVRKAAIPARNRTTHGRQLLQQLVVLARNAEEVALERKALDLPPHLGITIVLEISPRGLLDYKQLEWRREGIEVLSVIEGDTSDIVALHVPEGGLAAFEKRIQDYLDKNTKAGKPANAALVDVIANFRRAAFDELWTDDHAPLPAADAPQWFQLWLRRAGTPVATRDQFVELAQRLDLGILVESGFISFPGRVVVAARATRSALERAISLLDLVAEIRSVAATAEFFLSDLTPADQVDWVRNLESRLQFSDPARAPYVTLLDTGVNHGHPLLAQGLDSADMYAIDPAWLHADHDGHGTQMAGLTLHGNLTNPLASSDSYLVPHRLESVKILPPIGQNSPHLYGPITTQVTAAVEKPHPARRRTFAMMTTAVGKSTGLPSEWSATIDQLAFGSNGSSEEDAATLPPVTPRLFVLSAGNVPWPAWTNYPDVNDLSPIESPAQAWNALTVGAYTEMTDIDLGKWPSLVPIGPSGALSPSSSTSVSWRRAWPFKPDVVAEGGNGCLDAGPQVIVGPESLRLLTTHHDMTQALLTESGDTSAATAEVARLCAHLSDRYPTYWPETLRALVIHGARYTGPMRATLPIVPIKRHKETLLRRFGYGAIEGGNSLFSTTTQPTLVLEEKLTPYRENGANITLNGVNMHALPWPAAALQDLGEASVALRVTLSYFIDPNPSQRGWQSKFRYQSHGLRFAVKGATETAARFGQRINKIERDEAAGLGDPEAMHDPDLAGWFLGAQLRSRGSVHSDVWMGTAAQLAEKSHIAVFPVGGWWKDWKEAGLYASEVRYSLVVTLEALEAVDIDLYTPVLTQIQTPIVVTVPV